MPYDLVLSNPTFTTGKFGQGMSGGNGTAQDVFLGLTDFTLEAWIKTTATGAIRVAAGSGGCAWMGINANGTARGSYGNGTGRDMNGPVVNDDVRHHLAICISATTGGTFWVDGAQAATAAVADAPISKAFGVRYFGGVGGFDWIGEVDEVAVTAGIKYTQPFTPGPVSNNQAGLRAVWHLDGDGVNSAGLVATAPAQMAAPVATAGVSSASVALAAPADGGSPITGYTVVSNPAGGTDAAAGTTALNRTITGLAAGTAYTFTATATNTVGPSPASPASNSVTPTAAATAPAAPTIGTAVAGNGYVDVYFTRNSNGGSAVIDSTATLSTGQTATGTTSPIRVTAPNGTAVTATVKDRNTVGPSNASAASNSVTPTAPANALDTTKVVFSPLNWDVQAGAAKTINSGAYFKTLFGGTACTLNFDMTGVSAPYPILEYRVDDIGPVQTVTLAASITISMPSETAAWPIHFLRMDVRSTSEAVDNWSGGCAVSLTGVILDAGKSLSLPSQLPLSGLFLGDSITRGINTLTNAGDATVRSSAMQGWAYISARMLGAECGIVGFGGQGLTVGGAGNIPIFGSTYNFLRSGVARSFAAPLDFVVINQGTNDGANDITTSATAILNGLLAALPSSTKIIVLRPFNGAHDTQWTAAINACSAPARINHVDTTGWFTSANSSDGLHPYGYENIWHIAPAAATAIKGVLAGAPQLTQRTVTVTLASGKDASNNPIPAASLTGIKVSVYDEASPELRTVARYQSGAQTTSASGVMTFQYGSTLAAGAKCGISVQTLAGDNFDFQATVA